MVKAIFRIFLSLHVFLYRMTGGTLGSKVQGLNILLLTTTGRKSGQKRTIPLGYFVNGEGYVIIGSNSGSDAHPAWYHNLKNDPHAEIQVGGKRITVNAEDAGADERGRLWARLMELSPAYGNYAKKTKRVIPMVTLTPVTG